MTNDGQLGMLDEYHPGGRRKKSRGVSGCIPVLVALLVVAAVLYVVVTRGLEAIQDRFGEPEDYPGPGTTEVSFEVRSGDTSTAIGRSLKEQKVVASVDAFVNAARDNPQSAAIQPGFYALREEMKAADVVTILVDPSNMVTTTVTIPEGLRVVDTVDILAAETEFGRRAFNRALNRPGRLGLPAYADGNAEGYLFPATYRFGPADTPMTMLKAMVDRWKQSAVEHDLEGAAERLGYTPHELMTVASLVEAEGRGDDMPKIARVIFNRVENPGNGITNGLLQIDAAVNYALGERGIARLTQAQIDSVADSPYNTYTQPGLPPGPIEAPGDDSIRAATDPADGDWLFYVTVNLETGETRFTSSYDEFLQFKAELQSYCDTQSDRC